MEAVGHLGWSRGHVRFRLDRERRGCQELCVRSSVEGVGDSAGVGDGERIQCLFPALGVAAEFSASVVADVVDGEVKDFEHGVVGGELPTSAARRRD